MNCADFPLKSMAYIDDEMSPEERAAFEAHVEECRSCRVELEKMRRVKEMTVRVRMADLEDREWEAYWARIYNRGERFLGWILFSVGVIITLVWGMYRAMRELLADPSVPIVFRAGIFALVVGLIILLVSVARQRLHAWRSDPYREVKR